MKLKLPLIALLLVSIFYPQNGFSEDAKQKSGADNKAKATETKKQAKPNQNKDDAKIARGEKLFGTHCASCHADGGNRVTPSKPVKGSAVTATLATFKAYLNEPVGNMPHYEHLIKSDKMLGDLHAYVRKLDKEPAVDKTGAQPIKKKD